MSVDFYTYTNSGSRKVNEDSFKIEKCEIGEVAVVCDGLGGHDCGEVASKMACENFVKGFGQIKPEDLNNEIIHTLINAVNENIIKHQEENKKLSSMRTTVAGCVIDKEKINYFNCGDSRFYFFSNGSLECMTKDHSVPQMSVDLGEMSFDEIRFDADRNKLLKVLGLQMTGDAGTVYKPVQYKPGDAFLLCSDGFWEYVLEEEMEIDLSKAKSAKEWVDAMIIRLLLRMTSDNDNFTVVGGIIE